MAQNIRLRQSSIDRRKQALQEISRSRRRKLSLLYCLSNVPSKPLNEADISKIGPHLKSFLDSHEIDSETSLEEADIVQDKQKIADLLGLSNEVLSPSANKVTSADNKVSSVAQPKSAVKQLKNLDKREKRRLSSADSSRPQEVKRVRRSVRPTPYEESSFELSKIKQSQAIIDKEAQHLDVSLDEDKAKKLFLLLGENMPTKISKTMPLSKLFYYSRSLQMVKLLANSNKVLTTDLFESSFLEGKISVVHSRIEELQKQGKWCLKQPRRFLDPFKQKPFFGARSATTHWDNLLNEAVWMATDYKEGKKYKIATCYYLSNAVMEYHELGESVCIKRKPIRFLEAEEIAQRLELQREEKRLAQDKLEKERLEKERLEKELLESEKEKSEKVKELSNKEEEGEENGENERNEDEAMVDFNAEEFISNEILGIESPEDKAGDDVEDSQNQKEATADASDENSEDKTAFALIQEPTMSPKTMDPQAIAIAESIHSVDRYETDFPFKLTFNVDNLSGVSKSIYEDLSEYTAFSHLETGKSQVPGSEFDYTPIVPISKLILPFENDQGWYKIVEKPKPEEEDQEFNMNPKGLFSGPGSYRRVNSIRPPQPPPLDYLELRTPTIWLPEDDELLLKYGEQFAYNWNVISAHLSAKTTKCYVSNIERRTPWQCFERFLQLSDKISLSDLRGPYAQSAHIWLDAAQKVQKATKRRLLPLGVGKESIQRGNTKLRWASMFEAMKKIMKKRESVPKPNSYNSFKKQMSAEDKSKILTPSDLSRMKFERERPSIQNAANRGRVVKGNETNTASVQVNVKSEADGDKLTPSANRVENISAQNYMKQNPNYAVSQSGGAGKVTTSPLPSATITSQQQASVNFQKMLQNQQASTSNSKPSSPNSKVTNPGNRGQTPQQNSIHSQVSAIINQIQAKNPTWTNEEVTRAAARHITLSQSNFLNNSMVTMTKNDQSGTPKVGDSSFNSFQSTNRNAATTANAAATAAANNLPVNFPGKFAGGRLNLATSLTQQQKNQIVLRLLQKSQQQQQAQVGVQGSIAEKSEQQKQLEKMIANQKLQNSQTKNDGSDEKS